MKKILLIFLVLILLPLPSVANAACTGSNPYTCSSISDLNTQISNAVKGDTIILSNGSYSGTIEADTSGLVGGANEPTEAQPVIIKAATPGQASVISVNLNGTYTYVHGFNVTRTSGVSVTIRDCTYCRFTNNKLTSHDKGIEVRGTDNSFNLIGWAQNNRIDHNEFTGGGGITIEIYGIDRLASDPNRDYTWLDNQNTNNIVDRNYFNTHRDSTQEEAMQIGRGSLFPAGQREFDLDYYTIVEYNHIYQYYGDNEVISNKSSSNTYRYNVIEGANHNGNYEGSLTLRGGDDCTIEGNFIIWSGSGVDGLPGLRVYGENHKVINNYIEGVFNGIRLHTGDASSTYLPIVNLLVANNFIRYAYGGGISNYGSNPTDPDQVTLINNLVFNPSGVGSDCFNSIGTNITWITNACYLEGTGDVGVSDPGVVEITNPNMTDDGDVYRLSATSTQVIGQGTVISSYGPWSASVADDFDGQTRDGSTPDIGADEYDASAHSRDYASITAGAGTVWPSETDMSEFYPAVSADTTPPTLTSATIGATGKQVTLVFIDDSSPIVTTGYESGDFDLDCALAGNDIPLSSPTGSLLTWVFALPDPVYADDTCNIDFTGGAGDITDSAGTPNDMDTCDSCATVTNNSVRAIHSYGVTGTFTRN